MPDIDNRPTDEEDQTQPLMGREEESPKPEGRKYDPVSAYAAAISAGVFVALTWSTVLSNGPTKLGYFAPHPLLQSLAIALFTYGILTLQPTSHPTTRAAGLNRHQRAMFSLGLPIILLGSALMWYNKHIHGAKHFTTWHGKFGLISIIWIIAQVLVGGGSVWFNGAAFGGGSKAKALWKHHRASGYLLLALLLVTAHLGGAWSDWVVTHSDIAARYIAYSVCPVVILASVYSRIRPSKIKFF